MREEDALRLLDAIERQRLAARRIASGTIDGASVQEYAAMCREEQEALRAIEGTVELTSWQTRPQRGDQPA